MDYAFLLDTIILMEDRSYNDRLALSYQDTGMLEICPVYFAAFPSLRDAFPLVLERS